MRGSAVSILSRCMTAKPLLDSLRGGDRRSIGRANAVAAEAAADPRKLAVLVEGLMDADPVVRMRAADELEKATAAVPTRLDPHKQRLIALAAEARQHKLRWHLAQMLPRLSLTLAERGARRRSCAAISTTEARS